ncbi:MAG: multidrug transporter ATP-binding protein [Clostridiales bacterium]|jgi:ATP-binding cassette subfamily B protein|nr:multidrug transporter ATP-binding protein [Clostridiales bacterium]
MEDNKAKNPRRQQQGPFGGGPMGGMGAGEKAKNFKATMVKLGGYLKPFTLQIIVVLIFAIGSTVFTIVGPKILAKATNKLAEGITAKMSGVVGAGIDFGFIAKILIMLAVIYAVSVVFMFIQSYVMAGVSQKITYNFRKQIDEKINKMPLKYFDTMSHGEILSRITNDVDTISQSLSQSMTQIITSITALIGIIIMMLSISPTLTGITVLVLPISMILIMIVVKKSQKFFSQRQEYLGKVNGHIEEMYGGHIVMKAFNGEEKSIEQFEVLNNKLYGSTWKAEFLSGLMMPLMMFVGNLGYVVVTIMGGWLVVKGNIKIGDIQAFIQYVRSFNQPIAQTAQMANVLQSTAAAAERVFEFLGQEEEIEDVVNGADISNIKGTVEFKDVSFGYNEDKIIINNFSAKIKPGQKVAIVGPTGAGKTTMVKLLMRFYDVNSGAILVDGHDIREYKRDDLRSQFGMVLQDTWLYNGTIRENIRYGNLNATDDEIKAASKSAHAHHFIKTLPDGYDLILNEEASNVSQGQKQLLTIARAILSDPKILILDEATSSVDTRTEIFIQKAMENLMSGRTSFIIAHRLSTIRDADLILVMNDGDIVEQGSHEELIGANGFYASLYNSQFSTSEE